MVYNPSLEDINSFERKGSYKPSLSDIDEKKSVNPKEVFNQMTKIENPNYNTLQSFLQGVAKGGQKIAQLLPGAPDYDLTGVFGNKTTNDTAESIGQYLPTAVASIGGIPGILGAGLYGASQANPGNRAEEGLYSSLGALGGNVLGKGIKGISALVNKARGKLDSSSLAKMAQESHNIMDQQSSNIFKNVKKEAYSRGIDQIPIDMKLIKEAKKYLPKTISNKNLIENAQWGDYSSLRKLQSDLGQRGSSAKLSKFMADQDKGDLMLDLRERINKTISDHLKNTGNEDLATKLNNGRKIYKDMQKIFYTNKSLGRLVHPDKLEVPENVEKLFSKNSKTMNEFRQLHPNITNALSQLKTMNDLKKLGITGGGIGGALIGLESLKSKPINSAYPND